ncbi:MAG TPA: DUF116 domain-containing protein [bacterium]|nr:DUF116 domain-containing protein [bacterium]
MPPSIEITDRRLGDEWKDWNGDFGPNQADSRSGKRIFLGLLLIWLLALGCGAGVIWYLIAPRLTLIHPVLPTLIGGILFAVWALLTLWFGMMILAILTRKHFLFRFRSTEICLTSLVPVIQNLGRRLGLHPDRIGHSFVRVSNALIRTIPRKIRPDELLILLPRCLRPALIQSIRQASDRYGIRVFTVPGGELARQKILEYRPKAVIGVACERDLVSGIRDIVPRIPVIGIPNTRPEGPCKNTCVDITEFENAVQSFIGKSFRILQPENELQDA